MSSTDRNQKLKNYHARKVRERQVSTVGPMKKNEGHHSFNPTLIATATTLKSSKSRSSRSLFATGGNYSTVGGGGSKISAVGAMIPKETKEGRVELNSGDSVVSSGSVVSSSLRLSTSSSKSTAALTTTKLNKIPPQPSSTTSEASNKLNNNPKVSRSTPQGGSSSSSSENSTPTNNATAAAKMFAARRRRAQLEMTSGGDSSVASVGGNVVSASASGGVALATSSLNAGEKSPSATASLNFGSKSSRGSMESVKSSSRGRSSTSSKGGGGGEEGGRISSSSSLATRKAYERYSGNNSSGSSVSSFDGGSIRHHHRGSSSNDHSGGRSRRPSSAPMATAMNGINSMNSMDSTDNSTIATAHSMDYSDRISKSSLLPSNIVGRTIKVGDDTAKRAGLESLSTIREVSGSSFSSMATIQVSNCQQKSEEVESNDAKEDGSSDDAAGDNKSGPTPILKQPHLHEIKAVTKDEDDGQPKLVRFDLSPLKREKKVDAGVASMKVVGRVAQHDDVLTTDSALPASTTLTSLPSADAIQSINGGDEARSSVQKSSPSSKDDTHADNTTPRMSDEVSQSTDAAADQDEYDEEFAVFMNGLRREVAGDHTKVRFLYTHELLR